MEPAIAVDHLSRCFRALVVALHHIGAAGADLAILDFHLTGGKRPAHTSRNQVVGTTEGDDGRTFRHAVALDEVDAQGMHAMPDLRIQRRTTAHTDLYVSAQHLVHFPEDRA